MSIYNSSLDQLAAAERLHTEAIQELNINNKILAEQENRLEKAEKLYRLLQEKSKKHETDWALLLDENSKELAVAIISLQKSDLRFMIDRLFRESNIVMALPQRDVHLNADRPLRMELISSSDKNIPIK